MILVENNCNLSKLDEEGKTVISWAVNRKNEPSATHSSKYDDSFICQCLQFVIIPYPLPFPSSNLPDFLLIKKNSPIRFHYQIFSPIF